ncbi:MAG: hypothetical protein EAY75_03330 [Bacteroidetes bacterium]|nr:MAG: hypothetical protein EAY75_03330 [Bacteroidota bacterium]
MDLRKPGVDVVADLLQAIAEAFPTNNFSQSLLQQYAQRGFLTKKQLEGLHSKAKKLPNAPVGKLATLEAIILKMPTRQKSALPQNIQPLYEKNVAVHLVISAILEKYPEHKQVLVLKTKNRSVLGHVFSASAI